MQHEELVAIETQLKDAQVQLDLHMAALPIGDARITRAQEAIDGLWALFNRARQNSGSVTPADFAPGFAQLQAELQQVVGQGK